MSLKRNASRKHLHHLVPGVVLTNESVQPRGNRWRDQSLEAPRVSRDRIAATDSPPLTRGGSDLDVGTTRGGGWRRAYKETTRSHEKVSTNYVVGCHDASWATIRTMWNDRDAPLAYLITFRTKGTW